MIINETFKLRNGVLIPKIGYGTWQIKENAYESTLEAIKHGYRHIDTARAYGNEKEVGRAIKDSNLKREDIFITSKLPAEIKGYDKAIKYFKESIEKLGVDYLDLYLIHAPWPWSAIGSDHTEENIETWKAFIKLYNDGLVRAIGVSNFSINDLNAVIQATNFIPHVNQVRIHIGHTDNELRNFCQEKGILVEAYSPLATGRILDDERIVKMAGEYHVTPAQICIRFCLEINTLPLPKSTNSGRIKQNSEVDFQIQPDDLQVLLNISE